MYVCFVPQFASLKNLVENSSTDKYWHGEKKGCARRGCRLLSQCTNSLNVHNRTQAQAWAMRLTSLQRRWEQESFKYTYTAHPSPSCVLWYDYYYFVRLRKLYDCREFNYPRRLFNRQKCLLKGALRACSMCVNVCMHLLIIHTICTQNVYNTAVRYKSVHKLSLCLSCCKRLYIWATSFAMEQYNRIFVRKSEQKKVIGGKLYAKKRSEFFAARKKFNLKMKRDQSARIFFFFEKPFRRLIETIWCEHACSRY